MGNVLTVHMKANTQGINQENVDYEWNNGTLLGELIEKALLKNTPAQKLNQTQMGMQSTDYNTILRKKACCLGLVPESEVEIDETNLPKINVPIANIGPNANGLPNASGTFTPNHDEIFSSLPIKGTNSTFNKLKTHSTNFHIKPKNSNWFKSHPTNKDMTDILNSNGMVSKRISLRDNNGNRLLDIDDCKMKRESWEETTNNSDITYTPYNKNGIDGKAYDDAPTEACDDFYGFYGRQQANDRQCLKEVTKNGEIKYEIDLEKPGCNSTMTHDGKSYPGYMLTNEIAFNPMFNYPNDTACVNSAYGSTYTDTASGQNKYTAGGVFLSDPNLANPIGIDSICKDFVNNPSNGEAYALRPFRIEANLAKCVNALVLNDIEADTVEISDINQSNQCSTSSSSNETTEDDELNTNDATTTDPVSQPPIEADIQTQESDNQQKRDTSNNQQDADEGKNNTYIYAGIGILSLLCFLIIIMIMLYI